MEREFVTYEIALALKKLGFDEPCFGWWFVDEEMLIIEKSKKSTSENIIQAPTYSQAFRFFREKHNLIGSVESEYFDNESKQKFYPVIKLWATGEELDKLQLEHDELDGGLDYVSKTYEEAELACLIKLIEIVKSK